MEHPNLAVERKTPFGEAAMRDYVNGGAKESRLRAVIMVRFATATPNNTAFRIPPPSPPLPIAPFPAPFFY